MTPYVASPLTPLEHILRSILDWLHGSLGLPWAWSIVVLTILVRMVLVPLMLRQIHSMQSLQVHAPEMKAIQQKWKHDRQRQNEELMKFYRENKINPAASCLPMVAQIPVFFSLYLVLRHFERHVPTGDHSTLRWLDLVNITEPVRHGWGPLLLVIYVISQLSSSWYMSTTMQGAQRWMLMVLPVVFVPFLINFPSGLMIYWLTTNLWTTGQGVITRRLIPKPEPPPKKSSRTAPQEAPDSGNGVPAKQAAPKTGGTAVAGPPRRVKRKRGGGGRRR
ncbi:MAG: YidC/Oxa1 family membrane protein insertase [Actinobacteria bacterium]|nr:MAG: YidC/Oxa1 family membrane protein insertase [Actinomycetota bacterium]